MAWTQSRIFREWLSAALEPRDGFAGKWFGPDETFMAALYWNGPGTPGDGSFTPNETVTASATAYDGGVWTAAPGGAERVSPVLPPATQSFWPAGGLPITGTGQHDRADPPGPATPGFSSSGILIVFDGDDTGTGNELVTLDEVYGDLTYDTDPDTVQSDDPDVPEDQGACFHFYGGVQRVTSGTFTIVWSPDGIMRVGVGLPGGGP